MPKSRPIPTVALENFLYLLTEIEASLARGTIRWTPAAVEEAQRRAAKVLADLGAIIARLQAN
jgi:hypothetical protein